MKKEFSKTAEIFLCLITITAAILIALCPIRSVSAADTDKDNKIEICDIAESPAANELLYLANSGIIPVYEKDNMAYCLPQSEITREYVATAIIKLLNIDASQYESINISLIDAEEISSESLPYVKAALYLRIMPAFSDKVGNYDVISFYPSKKMTRQEAAGALGSVIGGTVASSKTSEFNDADEISNVYLESIEKLIGLGIMQGYEDNTFKPNKNINAEEFALMLYKAKQIGTVQS